MNTAFSMTRLSVFIDGEQADVIFKNKVINDIYFVEFKLLKNGKELFDINARLINRTNITNKNNNSIKKYKENNSVKKIIVVELSSQILTKNINLKNKKEQVISLFTTSICMLLNHIKQFNFDKTDNIPIVFIIDIFGQKNEHIGVVYNLLNKFGLVIAEQTNDKITYVTSVSDLYNKCQKIKNNKLKKNNN